ncbi:speedy protein A isoform X1 [Synchiropus splendidus]|uniref:speedy protein A isoform X1 n=3 Tax=Synchiropus splendidus TaxID=270530 RepID=UPI00237E990A|nr:speedy protein A isoform X1 [Synchiropus splendidus]XP_053702044.1 speedy protein A isoform X1 [Synchiropus splendidus]XP_053702045.1 speedy protein A isoform X1 [Synchiropus splendidus]
MMKRRHSDSPTPHEETVSVPLTQDGDVRPKKQWNHSPQRGSVQMSLFRNSWRPTVFIQGTEIAAYLRIFEDELLKHLLWKDCCYLLADKYLLAMVFEYFKRCSFTIEEYTKENFFIALFLANNMEEEDGYTMVDILSWALGNNWRQKVSDFVRQRDKLWARMNYRAVVTRRSCEEIMDLIPAEFLWRRERPEHHGGVQRYCEYEPLSLLGPSASPVFCARCYTNRFPGNNPVRSSASDSSSEDEHESPHQAFYRLNSDGNLFTGLN